MRVKGPKQSSENDNGIPPYLLTRPCVPFIPTKPQRAAGILTEPPVSDPRAPKTNLPATADPDPDEDPPGACLGFHGFLQSPKCKFCPTGPLANSDMFNPPRLIAPAASNRFITVEV